MAARRMLQLGDPLLRSVSLPVASTDAGPVLRDLEETLAEFRRTHGFGRAISAIQIGAPLRVIFMEVDGVRYELLNPEFTWRSPEMFELWDDCFSFPNLMVRLQRHCGIRLKHEKRDGSPGEIAAAGALSELIQHEMDHLDGVLAVDRALGREGLCTREEWLRQGSPA
jgi:peptide deformylase